MVPTVDASQVPLLEVRNLGRRYTLRRASLWRPAATLEALADINFSLPRGKSLGVVGESGSGKSTLARLVMALDKPSSGSVRFCGVDLHGAGREPLRALRSGFQMVFQDPFGSLNPRHTVLRIVTEPLLALGSTTGPIRRAEHADRAAQALSDVGLRTSDLGKYPHEFSGGQRQRIAIARALITRPALIVADEPVSALDVSVQAQVLNLLQDLQQRHGLSFLLISHDLAVVNLICDDVIVLNGGRVVEQGPASEVLRYPRHVYTRALLAASPGGPSSLSQESLHEAVAEK